jgi:hypothetical protein
VILFRFDQQDAAIDVLLKNSITVLPGEKLYSFLGDWDVGVITLSIERSGLHANEKSVC